jgi:hypothetical protein
MPIAARYQFSSPAAFQAAVAHDAWLSAAAALAVSMTVGLLIARAVLDDEDDVMRAALAPGLGLAATIVFGEWAARLFGITATFSLLLVLFFAACLLLRRSPPRFQGRAVYVMLVGAALIALVPIDRIFPKFDGDALYFGRSIYDHLKTAIIDAMAREGMPPHTPYISSNGIPIDLNYYYGWHLLAAVLRTLPGNSSLGADIGLTWVTGFATMLALAGLAWRLQPSIWSIIACFFVMTGATLAPVMRQILPDRIADIFLSKTHPIEGYILQAAWVPQHVASGLFVVLSLLLAGREIDGRRAGSLVSIVTLAVLLAAAIMTSAWTGGVAPVLAAAAALPCLMISRALREKLAQAAPRLTAAAVFAAVLLSGYLLYLRGLRVTSPNELTYLAAWVYPTSTALPPIGFASIVFNSLNFISIYALIHIGLAYPAGLHGLYCRPNAPGIAGFVNLSRAFIPATFVVVLFLRSALIHNDLGWRGILPGIFLLYAFAGSSLAGLIEGLWHRRLDGARITLATLAAFLLAASLAGTYRMYQENILAERTSKVRVQHTLMLDAGRAWARIQALTAPDAIIMANPTAFENVTKPGGNAPWALFGDRRLFLTDFEWGLVFAHHVAVSRAAAAEMLQTALFAGNVGEAELQRLRDEEKVAAILVAPGDQVHGTGRLNAGGYFRLVERVGEFEIHLAAKL